MKLSTPSKTNLQSPAGAKFSLPIFLAFVVVVTLLPVSRASAERSCDPLVKLVGADANLCIELNALAGHWPDLVDSDFFDRFQKLRVYREWLESEDYRQFQKKLVHVREAVEQATGKPAGQFVRDIFGNAVVFAAYSSGDGEFEGVVLTQAVTEEALRGAVLAWNKEQGSTTESLSRSGLTYFRRTRTMPKGRTISLYYAVLGRIFATSDEEAAIQQVVDLAAFAAQPESPSSEENQPALVATQSLLYAPAYLKARAAVAPDSVATVFFNPRGCQEALLRGIPESELRRSLTSLWKRCESIIVGARVDDGVVLEAVAHYDHTEPSERWRDFLGAVSGAPDFLPRVPRNAMAVVVGRHDLAQLPTLLLNLMSERQQREWLTVRRVIGGLLLGRDLIDDVLPALGPNWCAYVVPRKNVESGVVPVNALVALQLPRTESEQGGDENPALRTALDNGLSTGLNLLAAVHNGESPESPAVVKTEQDDAGTVRWIESLGPYQPAFSISDESLILSSSPGMIAKFMSDDPQKKVVNVPVFHELQERYFPSENHLFAIDLVSVRRFLAKHRDELLETTADAGSDERKKKDKELDELQDVLTLFDGAFAAAHIDENRLRLVVGGVVLTKSPAD